MTTMEVNDNSAGDPFDAEEPFNLSDLDGISQDPADADTDMLNTEPWETDSASETTDTEGGGTEPWSEPDTDFDAEFAALVAGGSLAPDPEEQLAATAALSAVFTQLESFNEANDPRTRFANGLLDGLNKGARKEKYMAEGMTEEEAVNYIINTEGEHSQAVEEVRPDHEIIALTNEATLQNFGLQVDQDLLEEAHVEVTDGAALVAGLSGIAADNVPPEIQRGLNSMLKGFAEPLFNTVVVNNQDTLEALDAIPYWMKGHTLSPEPEAHEAMLKMFEHSDEIANQCQRLGADEHEVARLRQLTRYHNENALPEWTVAEEMGFFTTPYGEEGGLTLYRQHHDESWDMFWRTMDHAEAKSQPGDTFVADVRDAAVECLTVTLRAYLTGKRGITREDDATKWPDPSVAEALAAEQAAQGDDDIAEIIAARERVMRYGHKYDNPEA